MTKSSNPENWPTARGPWPEVHDLDRLYDHGASWCAAAAGHPDHHDEYPDPTLHLAVECRSHATNFDDACVDVDGAPVTLEVYAAIPFRFGELRGNQPSDAPRIVFDSYPESGDETAFRVSLPLGEALRLSQRINRLVDLATMQPNSDA